jgi:hypothetical protein
LEKTPLQPIALLLKTRDLYIVWGRFGEQIGLIRRPLTVPLKQKRHPHIPLDKVLEFLARLKHLQGISLSTHPPDKLPAVAVVDLSADMFQSVSMLPGGWNSSRKTALFRSRMGSITRHRAWCTTWLRNGAVLTSRSLGS